MVPIPHDRLHKLLAVGGLVVAAASGFTTVERYHQAEIQRIEAEEKASAAKMAYERFAEAAERQIEASRSVRGQSSVGSRKAALDDFWKLGEEADKRRAVLDAAILELQKHGDLNKHYAFIKRLWLYVGTAISTICLTVSLFAFVYWRRVGDKDDAKKV